MAEALNRIAIIHREKARISGSQVWGLDESDWVRWETCLRQVYFGAEESIPATLPDDVDVYVGAEAYTFCMTTVCGLKSPLVAETEVWGQFKALFRNFHYDKLNHGMVLQRFVEAIFTDAKMVRHRHLTGLGSQSYGSLARRLLKGTEELTFIGAGSLVKDMLPWLVKGLERVNIACRRLEAGEECFAELKVKPQSHQVVSLDEVASLESPYTKKSLIIAAPVSAAWIAENFSKQNIEKVVDLRDNSTKDRVQMNGAVIPLQDFFGEIESTRKQVALKVIEAESEIRSARVRRFNQIQIRPYGWEDLCL